MSQSFDELREMIVGTVAVQGFDFALPFTVSADKDKKGMYIILQNAGGWAIVLGRDGTWFLDDTSGG